MPEAYVIPSNVFRALEGWALKAYVLIANSAQPLTSATIAAELGISERTARRTVAELRERGFLTERPNLTAPDRSDPKRPKQTATANFVQESFPKPPIKEFSPFGSAQEARTHSHELGFFVSQLTDDPGLTGLAEEFLRGEVRRGEDLEARGVADLKRHFGNWLPKYKALKEIEARQQQRFVVQNEAKAARRADSENLQRQLEEQRRAAESEEARAERERVLARFGRGLGFSG